ncbi:MAG: hypothetical protein ABR936_15470 [Bacteroidota bacterium]|jgi:hypothetical protein
MTFQLTQEAQEAEKNKFKKALPWLSITFFPMLLCAFYPKVEFTLFLLGICSFFCFLGYFLIRSMTNMRLSVRISLDGDQLTSHIDGEPDKIINRNEIKKMIEIPKEGLQVNSNNSSQVIMIPLGLEGFQILKSELSTWTLQTEPSKTEFRLYLIGVYGTLAIIIAAIFLKSKFLWGLVLAIITIFFIYGFIQKIRSSKGISKWAPIIVPLLIALIAFILTKVIK